MIGSGEKKIGLIGRAGTGKTTCLEAIIAQYPGDIICAAPTNIAVDVMRQKLDDGRVTFKTVASALKTKKTIDYTTGAIDFIPTAAKTQESVLIIVDEASMNNHKTVHTLLWTYPDAIFIFVGDAGQLPPVKNEWYYGAQQVENYCVFDEIPCVELTTNMRCGQGNDLFDFIERLYQGDLSLPPESDLIKYATRHEITEEDISIVYRNETRRALNQFVFDKFWESTYQPGVRLIANETFGDLNRKKVFNSERMIINNVNPAKRSSATLPLSASSILRRDGTKYLEDLKISASGYSINFSVDEKVPTIKQELAEKGLWKDYYSFCSLYPDVSLGYSLTAYKSQGLTIPSPTLVWEDLMAAPPEILQKQLYVAASRASDSLKILLK
jgi:AAA domain